MQDGGFFFKGDGGKGREERKRDDDKKPDENYEKSCQVVVNTRNKTSSFRIEKLFFFFR